MGFIRKNANIILLFLLVISSAALIGATVFFQLNFDRLNEEYNYKMTQLSSVSRELQSQQDLLENVKQELSLKTAREEEFSEKYTEVRSTKEQLETAKKSLEEQKEELKADLQQTASQLSTAELEIDSKNERILTLEADIASCEDDVDYWKDKHEECETDLEDCQSE